MDQAVDKKSRQFIMLAHVLIENSSNFFEQALGQIDRVGLQVRQIAIGQGALMRRFQSHARRLPRLERLLPARRAEAPAIAGADARKVIIRHRRRKIVATRL